MLVLSYEIELNSSQNVIVCEQYSAETLDNRWMKGSWYCTHNTRTFYNRADINQASNRATRRVFRKKHSGVFTGQRSLVSKHPRLISERDTKIVIYRIWTVPHAKVVFQTSMHSSRMRTVRNSSCLPGGSAPGGCLVRGVWSGGNLLPGGLLRGGWYPSIH